MNQTGVAFSAGNAISTTFSAFFRRIVPFCGFAAVGFAPTLIFMGPYYYIVVGSMSEMVASAEAGAPFDPMEIYGRHWGWLIALFAIATVASMATTAIWLAATSFGVFEHMRGQPVLFRGSLRRGVKVMLPCLGALCLVYACILLAVGIVFVPVLSMLGTDIESLSVASDGGRLGRIFAVAFSGILVVMILFAYFGIRFMLVIAAIAVERPGVFAAFRRSWALTRGHWWRLFGFMLVVWLAVAGISFAVGIPLMFLTLVGGLEGMAAGQAINFVISMLTYALYAVAFPVAYVGLRRAKEGFGIEDIAAVFD
jgi:hypothetical protein